jgi:class 3 adenylate cyclase
MHKTHLPGGMQTMSTYFIKDDDFEDVLINGKPAEVLKKDIFDKFSPHILGLGDIKTKSKQVDAICTFFDLAGFTNFCKQVDPYLVLPGFLNKFLGFLFDTIKKETISRKHAKGYELWHDLPFFTKFTGDGLMILWNTEDTDDLTISNIIMSLSIICLKYTEIFFPSIKSEYTDIPAQLRCGVARGHVFSVGNGDDYVGACINIAARLQKFIPNIAVSKRGINIIGKPSPFFLTKIVNIRGIGANELIYVRRNTFEELSLDQKREFRQP